MRHISAPRSAARLSSSAPATYTIPLSSGNITCSGKIGVGELIHYRSFAAQIIMRNSIIFKDAGQCRVTKGQSESSVSNRVPFALGKFVGYYIPMGKPPRVE